MSGLPTLLDILSGTSNPDSPLAHALSILFESSPVLISTLEPQLAQSLSNASHVHITSYSDLIDAALATIASWDASSQSGFIAGHPRIGETKNMSNLSAKEQGAANPGIAPTPPEVLRRLAHLNACYEAKYPGLRYITFVNGRTRRAIAEEMENVLGVDHSLSSSEPGISSLTAVEVNGEAWSGELQRAIQDIGRIAKSRLKVFGVE